MRLPDRFRSLQAYTVLWIILPLSLAMFGLILAGGFAAQQALTTLLIDRDHQLARFSAARVAETLNEYANVLTALASNPELRSNSAELRVHTLSRASDALTNFNAGVFATDEKGDLTASFMVEAPALAANVSAEDYFQAVRQELQPVYSNVLTEPHSEAALIAIAVPVFNEAGAFSGALVGVVRLHNSALGASLHQLAVGADSFAYLVDRQGRVIFHPQVEQIGADYSTRPYVEKMIAGESGGHLWDDPSGERFIEGYAPVGLTGWGLVIQESWRSALSSVRVYETIVTAAGLIAIFVALLLAWEGARRIAHPIRQLAEQTTHLALGEDTEQVAESGIQEIDALELTFNKMSAQIASYRAGLRRYVGAITQSQEDERRRIARELHDETVQSLLAIARRLELYQASEDDPERLEQLAALRDMVTGTLKGVRQINRDLRPLILEDLGLVPAIRALVRAAHQGDGAIPHAKLDIAGEPVSLESGQELALYRITQEALTNVRKHARATGVVVELDFNPTMVCLEVSDDGEGFELPESLADLAQGGSFGLMGIQERVWALGGAWSIHSAAGQGTRLHIAIPRKNRQN